MAENDCNLAESAMAAAEKWAKIAFYYRPEREEMIADAISLAWEFSVDAGPNAIPSSIANFAVKWVAGGEHFSRVRRSVDDPRPLPKKPIRRRRRFTVAADDRNNPAVIAAFRIDTRDWMDSLPDRKLAILRAILEGRRTQDLAKQFSLTPGRISQIRRELAESYQEFLATE